MAAAAKAAAAKAAAMKPKRIRNHRRSVWYFGPFDVSAEVAELADGAAGLKVEGIEGEAPVCTLALGASDAKVDRGDIPGELEVPGAVWAALLACPTQARAVRGLMDKGEITIY